MIVGQRRLRADLRPQHDVDGLHRQRREPLLSRPARSTATASSSRSIRPPIPGADKLRLMSESARGEGGRVWVPRKPQDPRDPKTIPEAERYYFLEERYPKYGNLVPRDIATREIFNVCVNEGLSVERDRPCVYLDLTHIPRDRARPQARRHPRDLREVPGRRSARRADEDLPGRPLLDGRPVGRLRTDGRRRP